MADVFISYSRSHREFTRTLAKELEEKGVTVWWDTDLIAGESFRERIIQELKACKAAIVIWTPDSVHSDYVAVRGGARSHSAQTSQGLRP